MIGTTLILSLILFMFFFALNPLTPLWPFIVVGALGLASRQVRMHAVFWLAIVAITFLYLVFHWRQYSRCYLICYWLFAVMLAMQSKDSDEREFLLAKNAQYLLACSMTVAAISKFLSPDFLNGRFFMSWFMLSPQTKNFASAILGQSNNDFLHNQAVLHSMLNRSGSATLAISKELQSRMLNVSVLFSWFGMLMEIVLGILFFLPAGPCIFALRHGLLILFCLTCYAILPVFAFAAILIVLGIAQCRAEHVWLRRCYFSLVPLIALYLMMSTFNGWSKIRMLYTFLVSRML